MALLAELLITVFWILVNSVVHFRREKKGDLVSYVVMGIESFGLIQFSLWALSLSVKTLNFMLQGAVVIPEYLLVLVPIVIDGITISLIQRKTEGLENARRFLHALVFFILLLSVVAIPAVLFWIFVIIGNIFGWKILGYY